MDMKYGDTGNKRPETHGANELLPHVDLLGTKRDTYITSVEKAHESAVNAEARLRETEQHKKFEQHINNGGRPDDSVGPLLSEAARATPEYHAYIQAKWQFGAIQNEIKQNEASAERRAIKRLQEKEARYPERKIWEEAISRLYGEYQAIRRK